MPDENVHVIDQSEPKDAGLSQLSAVNEMQRTLPETAGTAESGTAHLDIVKEQIFLTGSPESRSAYDGKVTPQEFMRVLNLAIELKDQRIREATRVATKNLARELGSAEEHMVTPEHISVRMIEKACDTLQILPEDWNKAVAAATVTQTIESVFKERWKSDGLELGLGPDATQSAVRCETQIRELLQRRRIPGEVRRFANEILNTERFPEKDRERLIDGRVLLFSDDQGQSALVGRLEEEAQRRLNQRQAELANTPKSSTWFSWLSGILSWRGETRRLAQDQKGFTAEAPLDSHQSNGRQGITNEFTFKMRIPDRTEPPIREQALILKPFVEEALRESPSIKALLLELGKEPLSLPEESTTIVIEADSFGGSLQFSMRIYVWSSAPNERK
jgi:hypothetical protein